MTVLHLAYPLFACLLIALTVLGLVRAWQRTQSPRRVVLIALVVWLGALVFMTIRPGSGGQRVNLVPIIVDGPGSARDALLNAAVFLPLGLLLATAGWRVLPVLALALLVSLTIEVMQYFVNVGRTSDVNDLITNTAGAGIGWVIVWAIQRSRRSAVPARP